MSGIFLTLLLDVPPNDLFVDTDCTYKIASRPNTASAPIEVSEMWELVVQRVGSVALQEPNHRPDSDTWWDRDQQVYVILIGVHFLDDQVGSMLRQFFENVQQVLLHTRIENLAPVFGRPHQVIVGIEDTMAHSAVRGHRTFSVLEEVSERPDESCRKGLHPTSLRSGNCGGRIRVSGTILNNT